MDNVGVSLQSKFIDESFGSLLQISEDQGIQDLLKKISDGHGVDTVIAIGKNKIQLRPMVKDGNILEAFTKDGTVIFTIDSNTKKIIAGDGAIYDGTFAVDSTQFSGNLSGNDTDVQKALETLDELSVMVNDIIPPDNTNAVELNHIL